MRRLRIVDGAAPQEPEEQETATGQTAQKATVGTTKTGKTGVSERNMVSCRLRVQSAWGEAEAPGRLIAVLKRAMVLDMEAMEDILLIGPQLQARMDTAAEEAPVAC